MPQAEKSNKWFVRITIPHQLIKEKVEALLWVDTVRILMVSHVGEKTEKEHAHFCIEMSSHLQKQSLLARLKTLYGVRGNEQVSAKSWDGNSDACSYLFHDSNAEIILNKGFTESELTQFRARNADVQKIVEENKKRASFRCVDRILQRIKDGEVTRDYVPITMAVLKLIRDGEIYEPGDFMIKRYVEEVMSKSAEGVDWQNYAAARAAKLFPEWTT